VFIVVAQAAGRSFGIIVDEVFDTGEIVVKPMGPALRDISMFSGNTILGDGSVIMILDPNGVAAAIAGEATSESAAEEATVVAKAVDQTQALLLFRAGSNEPRAIPLSALTRLEVVDVAKIERSNGRYVLQYRGGLAPIVTTLADVRAEGSQAILIFSDGERDAGLAVDEIVDIVEADVNVELSSTGSGAMGSAVVDGRATEILDIGYIMSDVFRNWFTKKQRTTRRSRILLVDDSPFFRTMMGPLIRAAGYEVTEAPNAEVALRLMKEEGCVFELILSDIQMPGMDGRAFAKAVKADPQWRSTPVVGLTSEDDGDDAGDFDLLATKFDREVLIETIRNRLTSTERAA
jgi:two-component system chemotaxis sensor kinase CheA